MPEGLVWVQPEEQEQIARMRVALQDELAAALPELRHDHQFLRFLRGNGGFEKAVEKMRLALSYRSELATSEPFRAMRAATLQANAIDLSVLPYADEVLRHLPLRAVEGATVDGLPVCLSVTRLFHFQALTDGTVDDARLDLFLRAMIEQRALVCHQLSVARSRLVKCVDLRDLTGISVAEVLTSGRPLIAKLGRIIAVIQDFYPELIHKALIFNASPTFSQLFALVTPMLNARMKAKVSVVALGSPFAEVAAQLEARAAWSWLSQATAEIDYAALHVAHATVEYAVCWLEAGRAARWKLRFLPDSPGNAVKLRRIFMPAVNTAVAAAASGAEGNGNEGGGEGGGEGDEGGGEARLLEREEMLQAEDGEHVGQYTASEGAGMLLLCVDNYSAWWYAVKLSLELEAGDP